MAPGEGLEVAAHGDVAAETARWIVQRQALFREVNERIHEIVGDFGVTEGLSILCECASSECRELIELTQTEYEYLRRMPTRFAVLPGHDVPAGERVVRENGRFVTVESVDESDIAALWLDPRRRRT